LKHSEYYSATATGVPGIFAAGCMAALDAEKYLDALKK
jgi:thioredoxin reductase